MSSPLVRVRTGTGRPVANRSVYRKVETCRVKKRRQPTADMEVATLVQSSSAPSLAVAATAASVASIATLSTHTHGERAVMATICAIIATTPAGSSSSSSSSPSTSPTPSDSTLTPAVVLSVPAGWTRSSKRSKTPVLASPWSGHSHASYGDWMPQQDGASPASSTSTSSSSQTFNPMHRRSSLPCFPFPASTFPGTPTSDSGSSGSSSSSSSLHAFPPMPAGPSRLQSAPSAIRSLSRNSRPERVGGDISPLEEGNEAATASAGGGSGNKFENLQLRLAAHPAIRRLQQLDEAHDDDQHVDVSEEEDDDEDEDDNQVKAEQEEEPNQQPQQALKAEQEQAALRESPMMPVYAEVLSALPMVGLPVVDEAEHAPLAGLVTAFPFVQQFMPQPTRAEKKKKFIDRMHASHQLTITNNSSPTAAHATRHAHPTWATAVHHPAEDSTSPPLPAALPAPFRSVSTSSTFSSDDSQGELSSENDSCSHTDCSSSALADTFAGLSPHFHAARPTGFLSPLPPPSASFFLTPILSSSSSFSSSSSSTSSTNPFPSQLLPSPALHHAMQPVFASPAVLTSSCDESLCPDDLQLGEPAWGNEDGQWMGDW